MTGFVVTLIVLVGVPLLFATRTRISRLEHRLRLVEEELRRRIVAGSENLREDSDVEEAAVRARIDEEPGRGVAAPSAPVVPLPEPVVPVPEPEPEPEPVEDVEAPAMASAEELPETETAITRRAPRRGSFNFEDLFGRRLPIWAGGVTLAIAGVLIVKYAIDIGLFARIFTPGVQAVCGMLFGLGLIGGAEWAWRRRDKVDDPRVAQALAGAGISTLYAALLVAANIYGLIGPLTAFAGLAAVTAGALWLSLRHGIPSALLGLAGGLAAPALTVGLDADVPLLAIYLAFTIAALVGVSRITRWPWLGMMALAGGAGWSLWLVLAGQAITMLGVLSVGTFILLLAIALPLFAFRGAAANLLRAGSVIVGAVQLALLVSMGGFQPLHWGLFVLIAAAGQWLAWRDRAFAIVPTLGSALSVLLLLLWGDPAPILLAIIGLALAAIHAGPLLARLWSEPVRLQWTAELCAIAAFIPLVTLRHSPYPFAPGELATSLAAAGGAVLALVGAALGWKAGGRETDARLSMLLGTGGALLWLSTWLGFAHWQAPLWIGAIAAALLLVAPASRDQRIEPLAGWFSAAAVVTLLLTLLHGRAGEIAVLFGLDAPATDAASLLRWVGLAAIFALFGRNAERASLRFAGMTCATALLYGALAQLVPAWTLPVVMALLSAALLLVLRQREAPGSDGLVLPFAGASVLLLAVTGLSVADEWQRLWGLGTGVSDAMTTVRWVAMTGLFALFAIRARVAPVRIAGQAMGAFVAYGTAAQLVPVLVLPLLPAIATLALASARGRMPWPTARVATITFATVSAGWAVAPVGQWVSGASLSLAGIPMLFESPDLAALAVIRRVLGPALLLGGAIWMLRKALPEQALIRAYTLLGATAFIAVHALYRASFAAAFGADFIATGLAQRLVWDAILLAIGAAVWRRGEGRVASAVPASLAAIAALHVTWYSLALHNPLWSVQHVGSLPAANLLLPLFATLPVSLVLLGKVLEGWTGAIDKVLQPVLMAMVALFGWATLRQAFHGTLLVAPGVTQLEDIGRSILGIGLAVGYLLWGIRAQRHDWRVASLLLMLVAVGKVFLFDASGLEGLLRIASFVALGFSLIGIGWLYSRQLRREALGGE